MDLLLSLHLFLLFLLRLFEHLLHLFDLTFILVRGPRQGRLFLHHGLTETLQLLGGDSRDSLLMLGFHLRNLNFDLHVLDHRCILLLLRLLIL